MQHADVKSLQEKLIGAFGAGVKTVLLPVANRKDFEDVPKEVKEGMEVLFVGHIWEALGLVWPERWEGAVGLGESRL